ncbi:hypothetical protein DEO72_LG3g395 [Vigna unguiculata]|uniref:Uncharacterized protein n=1 Tax=Vigna unguiculata TaxID=3917 RepID=A0A4D6LC31_VIGUN|nr:hypothetical protein DEO72_LG3g395 [Vigna unguiculata]
MNQISLTTRLALNGFQAFCYSHHRNQSALDKYPNSGLPRPAPRSGSRVSLRRDVLAQASPLRLGEGLKRKVGAHVGSRLGENPLAWARCLLAQKAKLVAWATFHAKVLGELPVHLA